MSRITRLPALAAIVALAWSATSLAQPSITLNCWNDFPTQSNTVNGGPFRDSRQGSCPVGTDYVRVVEGQTEGSSQVTFNNLSPLSCFDLAFEYLNDGEDAGRIDLFANDRLIGSVAGNGAHDLERCEIVNFYNITLYTTSLTLRLRFHELSTTQFRHNGAVSLTFTPSLRQPLDLRMSGDPVLGGVITLDMQADASCEELLGYYLAGGRSATTGTPLPDGRMFPLDDPFRVGRGTLDLNAHGSASYRIPDRNPRIVGRTYYFAYVTFLPPGNETGTVGRISPVVPVTVLPQH